MLSFLTIRLVHSSERQAAKVMARVQSPSPTFDDGSNPSGLCRASSWSEYRLDVEVLCSSTYSLTMFRWIHVILPPCDPFARPGGSDMHINK